MNNIEEDKDRKIKELEDELARLKGQIVVTEDEYKGRPILKFSGAFRPFSMGLTKCRVILKSMDKIREFVDKYKDE